MFNQRGVRVALLALSLVLAFTQTVIDNTNNTGLTPLAPPTMINKPYCEQTGNAPFDLPMAAVFLYIHFFNNS